MYEECTTTNCSCRENEREGKCIKIDDKFFIHFSEVRQNAITVNTTCT